MRLGLEHFEHVRLEPVVITYCAREQHEFHFQIRLLGDVMALEVFELKVGVQAGTSSRSWENRTATHCRFAAA